MVQEEPGVPVYFRLPRGRFVILVAIAQCHQISRDPAAAVGGGHRKPLCRLAKPFLYHPGQTVVFFAPGVDCRHQSGFPLQALGSLATQPLSSFVQRRELGYPVSDGILSYRRNAHTMGE